MRPNAFVATTFALALTLPATAVWAQTSNARSGMAASLGVFVFAQQGQDATQQAQDEGSCYAWAREQSGVDPLAPAPAAPEAKTKSTAGGAAKGAMRGAAGGALLGTAVGAIAGDTGKGAAIGATLGATSGAVNGGKGQAQANARAEQQAAAQAQAGAQQQRDTFGKAFGACMDAKGYSVR